LLKIDKLSKGKNGKSAKAIRKSLRKKCGLSKLPPRQITKRGLGQSLT